MISESTVASELSKENNNATESSIPLVSVIIPSFNYARYLHEAVNSALAQTHRPIEVVIIDDGSTDGTRELIEATYGKHPEVHYIFQENQGLSAARNSGIREARGSWLVFLDADDQLSPHYIQIMLKATKRLPSTVALIAGQAGLIDSEGKAIPDNFYFPATEKEIMTLDLLVMNRIPSTTFTRKSAFENCGSFDTQLRASEDRDMWIRMSTRYRIFQLGEKLSVLRRHGENMSGNGTRQAACMRQVLFKAYRSEILTGWRRIYWLKIISHFLHQQALLESGSGLLQALTRTSISIVLWPYHFNWKDLGHRRPWFRLRTIGWLIKHRIKLKFSHQAEPESC